MTFKASSLDPLLSVEIEAGYKSQIVLRDLRFTLEHGQTLGLIGSSGAGKSTLVQSLLGLLPWRADTSRAEFCSTVRTSCGSPRRSA